MALYQKLYTTKRQRDPLALRCTLAAIDQAVTIQLVEISDLLELVSSSLTPLASTTPHHSPVVTPITDSDLLAAVLANAGPHLAPNPDLAKLYRAGYHHPTGSLIISNVGAILYCVSPRTDQPYLAIHLGLSVYRPGLGIEMANVALVGDVYDSPIVLRAESACSPSFLFGSQRCNCRHQWELATALAAHFNPAASPSITDGPAFERWVQSRAVIDPLRPRHLDPSPLGFVLLHLDSQNGMGSGYTPSTFCPDLYSRASMRHRGEYSAEQVHHDSMSAAFTRLGLTPDPRGAEDGLGYQTSFIILDYLAVNKQINLLSNNPLKWTHPLAAPYRITPVPMFGEINPAGLEEATSRRDQFNHTDIGELVSFDEELFRLTTLLAPLATSSHPTSPIPVLTDLSSPLASNLNPTPSSELRPASVL